MVKNYKFKCSKCVYEITKAWTKNEYEQAAFGGDKVGVKCGRCGYHAMNLVVSNGRIDDTFKPGWSQVFRRHFGTYQEYKQYFKDNGLVELGYAEFPQKPEDDSIKWSKEMAKKGAKLGLSDRQLDALRQGKTISDKGKLKENLKKLENLEKSL